MKIILLALLFLAGCGRSDKFYRGECLYQLHNDGINKHCPVKLDKIETKKVEPAKVEEAKIIQEVKSKEVLPQKPEVAKQVPVGEISDTYYMKDQSHDWETQKWQMQSSPENERLKEYEILNQN